MTTITKEERLTLRDILHDYKHHGDVVTQDYVEAHVMCMIEEAETRVAAGCGQARVHARVKAIPVVRR
jgi:hypothetical protein